VFHGDPNNSHRSEINEMKTEDNILRHAAVNAMRDVEEEIYHGLPGHNDLPRRTKVEMSSLSKNLKSNPNYDGVTQTYHSDEYVPEDERDTFTRAKSPILHGLVCKSGPLFIDGLTLTVMSEVRACLANGSISKFSNRIVVPEGYMLVFVPWFIHRGITRGVHSDVSHLRLAYRDVVPPYSPMNFGEVLYETHWVSDKLHTTRT